MLFEYSINGVDNHLVIIFSGGVYDVSIGDFNNDQLNEIAVSRLNGVVEIYRYATPWQMIESYSVPDARGVLLVTIMMIPVNDLRSFIATK